MVIHRRSLLGCLFLILTAIIFVVARALVEQPSPAQRTYTFDDATLYFETDRTTVWQAGDCVTLHWQVENISEIYWSQGPTVGVHTTPWCARQQVAIPFFTIHLRDGSIIYLAPFGVYTLRTRLFLTTLPLLLLAGWCFGLHHFVARLFERLHRTLRSAFSVSGQVHPLLVALFLGINAIVLWNALDHNPNVGYDAEGHYANVLVLSQGRLPTREDSAEFFSPPLPYAFPALVSRISGLSDTCDNPNAECYRPIQKLGQLQNVLVSIIVTFIVLRIGARMYPNTVTPRAVALFLLATLPVYYKTFAFMRGEPFVVLFTLLLCDHVLDMIRRSPRRRDALLIGLYGGMIVLSRQWGVLVLLGVVLWWVILMLRQRIVALCLFYPALAGGAIAVMLGGWFYLAMIQQTGTTLAFNRPPDPDGKPPAFFTGLGGEQLFTYPFSPGYDGQAVPIFYTEIWGDYFGYFHLQRPPIPSRMPPDALGYMGRVNLVSLFPTLIFLIGLGYGIYTTIRFPIRADISLFTLCVITSLMGFVWFVASYESGDADTAKATYALQIFPLLCLLTGDALNVLQQRRRSLFYLVVVLLTAVAIHNIPMYFSRIP